MSMKPKKVTEINIQKTNQARVATFAQNDLVKVSVITALKISPSQL